VYDVDSPYPGQRRIDALIGGMAARQRGVVARRQLLRAGVTRDEIDWRVAAGRLIPLHRGVYAVGHKAVTWEGRAVAALLAAGAPAALSHRAAAVAYEMLPADDRPIDVTVIGRQPRGKAGVAIHSAKELTVVRRRGLPVTEPARTLLDLATSLPSAVLELAYAEAQVRRLVTPQDIRAKFDKHRGAPALRRILDTTEPTRSAIERRLVRLVKQAGLPRPKYNAPLHGYEVDALWEAQRLVVETDGWAAHGHRLAFARDRARDADLTARGYAVLRFTWRQIVDHPDVVAARIAAALARRPPPPS
jgi:very-short-patch-repair endonuclease